MDIIYRTNSEFRLSDEENRIYRKELIYEGAFFHPLEGEDFAVTREMIDNWVNQQRRQNENGIKVAVPIQHTNDPEANRGFVVDMESAQNDEGKYALFGLIKFSDAEAEKLADRSDVSIFAPEMFVDGKGNTYNNPIRHVALTNDPVIPKLGDFKPIAASMIPEKKGMKVSELLEKFSLKAEEGKELEALAQHIKQLSDSNAELEKKLAANEKKLEASLQLPDEDEEKEKDKAMSSISASMVTMLRDNREMKLSRLIESGKITPAVSKKILASYGEDKALRLSLATNADNGFDDLLAALELNEPGELLGEKSGVQRLSSTMKAEDNPLLNDAKARS